MPLPLFFSWLAVRGRLRLRTASVCYADHFSKLKCESVIQIAQKLFPKKIFFGYFAHCIPRVSLIYYVYQMNEEHARAYSGTVGTEFRVLETEPPSRVILPTKSCNRQPN